eukprot:4011247-Amphidinium_carterae.1
MKAPGMCRLNRGPTREHVLSPNRSSLTTLVACREVRTTDSMSFNFALVVAASREEPDSDL